MVFKTLELIWENGSWKILQETGKGLQVSSEAEDSISPAQTTTTDQPTSDAKAKAPESAVVEAQAKPEEAGMTDTESRDFAAVEKFVDSWVRAWQQQDAITYLSYYSSNFIAPEGMSAVAWGKERLVFPNRNLSKLESVICR